MLTLKRDKDIRSNYAHDAIQALCQYTEYASNNDTEVQQLLLDVATVEYSSWATELDSISAVVNAGLGVVELPVSQVEQLERQSREAEAALMQQIQRADEADARRREKNREKKEKRARSSNPDSSQPTVSLLEYEPPPEQSSDEGDVAKKLDFDAEAQSQQAEVQEPNTPEQLLNQPAQVSRCSGGISSIPKCLHTANAVSESDPSTLQQGCMVPAPLSAVRIPPSESVEYRLSQFIGPNCPGPPVPSVGLISTRY